VALRWVETTYDLVLRENLSPPAAARVYAHTAIAMYEALVAGMPDRLPLAGQLTALRASGTPGCTLSQRFFPSAQPSKAPSSSATEGMLPNSASARRAIANERMSRLLRAVGGGG
jgi:hypothetical protein